MSIIVDVETAKQCESAYKNCLSMLMKLENGFQRLLQASNSV